MIYREVGTTGVAMSILALGGHEYLPDGRSRGFNEDPRLATRPGYIFDGLGGDKRKQVLAAAFAHGINFLDVTMDSEKEALGRNLKEIPPRYEIYIQTRPEGMVYGYDEYNAKMAQYELIKAEVQRGLRLLQRAHNARTNWTTVRQGAGMSAGWGDRRRHGRPRRGQDLPGDHRGIWRDH